MSTKPSSVASDPLWYRDAIIYEVHVRSYFDDNGDGIGDFKGLTQKLDYLEQLGVTAIWLLPFYPSPLRDDGYDIADYYGIHPFYGEKRDFVRFLNEAHRRGLRVITELIVNHTSDQHPWFQRARRAVPGSSHRNFYVWSPTPDRYRETRIIFQDFEPSNWSYDPVAKSYYWHRFYAHQPDLNFDHPATRNAILKVMDHWFNLGVDGMRLDAVPYLFEREGTDCENLPETHQFLKELRAHLDARFPGRMLLAEANQWPEDAAAYFGSGDQCHMNFHFPLMPRLFMSLYMEDRQPILDILDQTPEIPENCQWAIFLRNHDELTLEMVTEEERKYMYRIYAPETQARINLGIRRRLAQLLNNNRRRIELLNALLFSLPGTPVIYYGDELGMGDNIYLGDRNGVRTPMQWSPDLNAGFSSANPQKLYLPVIIDPEYHYQTVNVQAQLANPQSLLWWMKRMIALRRRYQAFGRGSIHFLHPDNQRVLAFTREYQNEKLLVVANLSRYVQYAHLDLHPYRGLNPVELIGHTRFPTIGDTPYMLTLGPHSFYWFSLESPTPVQLSSDESEHWLQVANHWNELFQGHHRPKTAESLTAYVKRSRWFRGRTHNLVSATISGNVTLTENKRAYRLIFLNISYSDAERETYFIPVGYASGENEKRLRKGVQLSIIARVRIGNDSAGEEGVIYDPLYEAEFPALLLEMIRKQSRNTIGEESLFGHNEYALNHSEFDFGKLEAHPILAEQSNTSIVFGNKLILKIYRLIEEGINPEPELTTFLTNQTSFRHFAPAWGSLEYRSGANEPISLGLLQPFIANQGDAWAFTLNELGSYYERVLSSRSSIDADSLVSKNLLDIHPETIPEAVLSLIGDYLNQARLLGRHTAELHLALASEPDDPAFKPEPFTPFYRRALYQSLRNLTSKTVKMLLQSLGRLNPQVRANAEAVLGQKSAIVERFHRVMDQKVDAVRIRTHGDLHLGQLLFTGENFIMVDFEGEPARPLEERRLKRCPLRDVAGMIRSFHYAALTALQRKLDNTNVKPSVAAHLNSAARIWYQAVSAVYLDSYLRTASGTSLLVKTSPEHLRVLLDAFLLEKAIYEVGYELNHRPDWVWVPLSGIREILGASAR